MSPDPTTRGQMVNMIVIPGGIGGVGGTSGSFSSFQWKCMNGAGGGGGDVLFQQSALPFCCLSPNPSALVGAFQSRIPPPRRGGERISPDKSSASGVRLFSLLLCISFLLVSLILEPFIGRLFCSTAQWPIRPSEFHRRIGWNRVIIEI